MTKEYYDSTLPKELNGIKFRSGWFYNVNKKDLEPYIDDDEKDSNYKSITIALECDEYKSFREVVYMAYFFTDIKKVGISGSICTVSDKAENKEKAREEFLRKLQEILPKLNLKLDVDKLTKRKFQLLESMKEISTELHEINSEINKSILEGSEDK